MDKRCNATSKSGEPCSAQPVRPSGYCYWHDAELEHERQANRRKGGAARSNQSRARRRYASEQMTLGEVNGLLALTLKGVVTGQIEPGVGQATASIARTIKDITITSQLEERIAELEVAAARSTMKGRSA